MMMMMRISLEGKAVMMTMMMMMRGTLMKMQRGTVMGEAMKMRMTRGMKKMPMRMRMMMMKKRKRRKMTSLQPRRGSERNSNSTRLQGFFVLCFFVLAL